MTDDTALVTTVASSSEPAQALAAVTKRKRRRPARRQVEIGKGPKKDAPPQTGQIFNIWYSKWSGGDKQSAYHTKEKAQTRCDLALDSGYTRADAEGSSDNKHICLFFSRGCCPYGSDCNFLHRAPLPTDPILPALDCFGRDKWADYRDDMGGVGNLNRINRTIYVGKIRDTPDIDEVVRRHFEEWGAIERIKILYNRGVAFVMYQRESSAQFAKEAMSNQSLDNDEILNVRWSTEDPNPVAKVREHTRLIKTGREGIAKRLRPDFIDAVEKMDKEESTKRIEAGDGQEEAQGTEAAALAPPSAPTKTTRESPEGGATLKVGLPDEASLGDAPSLGATTAMPPSLQPPAPSLTGPPSRKHAILTSDVLHSLAYVAATTSTSTPPPPPTALSGLAGYGSDGD